jgi:outer membrane immunogenic protein
MKRLLLGTAMALAMGAGASAADLPPMPGPGPVYSKGPSPMWNWTGCYVGGNIGFGWQNNSAFDDGAFADTGSDTGTGFVGGGQVGCDYQFWGPWVVGIQGMFDGAGVNGSHIYSASSPTDTVGTKTPWFGTFTGRIGYAFMPQTLVYFKGGAAWARNDFSDVDPAAPFSGQASATRSGWTTGVGVEYALQRNWSLFAEYNYLDFGRQNVALTYNCGAGCAAFGFTSPNTFSERNSLQTILVGLNLRFGGY